VPGTALTCLRNRYSQVCSETCQYSTNQRDCIPRQCRDFSPAGNATVSQKDQYHLKAINFSCPAGQSLAGFEAKWETCLDMREITCNVLQPKVVATGTVTTTQGDSVITLGGDALYRCRLSSN